MKVEMRIPADPPRIEPVSVGESRPLWSVMIPVYNCANFLPDAIRGVLQQDCGVEKMQIEVIDDASTDSDVEELVKTCGKGRIKYFRQLRNVGSLRNFQTCLERSRGQLIHLLHGDDRVLPGFYAKIEALFFQFPAMGAAFSRYAYVDDNGSVVCTQEPEAAISGILDDCLERLCERQRIQYVSMVVRRPVYEDLGGFYGVEYGEDWDMWVRIAAHYPVGYIPDVLAEYRRHFSSISGRSFITGENMRSLGFVMNSNQRFLPAEAQKRVLDRSKEFYAHYAMRVANRIWTHCSDRAGALAQSKAAWAMWRDTPLALKILKLYVRMALNL